MRMSTNARHRWSIMRQERGAIIEIVGAEGNRALEQPGMLRGERRLEIARRRLIEHEQLHAVRRSDGSRPRCGGAFGANDRPSLATFAAPMAACF